VARRNEWRRLWGMARSSSARCTRRWPAFRGCDGGRQRARGDRAGVIDPNRFMTLGTADEEGVPRVSPAWYAPAEYREFFWDSGPDARHPTNIAASSRPSTGRRTPPTRREKGARQMTTPTAHLEGSPKETAAEAGSRRAPRAWRHALCRKSPARGRASADPDNGRNRHGKAHRSGIDGSTLWRLFVTGRPPVVRGRNRCPIAG
jgi:hypothetical protein